jgi:carbamoylphosphate synthase large subunit
MQSMRQGKMMAGEKMRVASYQDLAYGEMHMVVFAECQSDWEAGIDTDGGTAADVKVTPAKIAGDGGRFLFGEVP